MDAKPMSLFAPIEGLAAPWDGVVLIAAVYVWTLALYFVIGGGLAVFARVRPEAEIPTVNGKPRRPRNTLRKDIWQSAKAIVVTALCTGGGLYAQYRGWALAPLELSIWSALWTFVVATVLFDLWFYAAHRLMHCKPLLRWHRAHHSNITPNAWSTDHFSLPDAFSTQSFFLLLPFILPMSPLAILAWRAFDQVKGMIGHSGYEVFANRLARWPFPLVAALHHDMHHQRFNVNFANSLTIWDRVFGTLDPEYDGQVKRFSEQRRI